MTTTEELEDLRSMQQSFAAHLKALDQIASLLMPVDPDTGEVWSRGRSALLWLKDAVAAIEKIKEMASQWETGDTSSLGILYEEDGDPLAKAAGAILWEIDRIGRIR